MKPTILFLFNTSPYASAPWVADGRFNVVHVDYDDTDHAGAHRAVPEGVTHLSIDLSSHMALGAVQWALHTRNMAMPSLVVSFPPCTDLAVSGAKHFARKLEQDPDCQDRAVRMAKLASLFGCPYIVENPVSVLATLWRKPDYYWHPCYYGGWCPEGEHPEFPGIIPPMDAYHKKTGAWVGNGFQRPTPNPVPVVSGDNPGWAKLGGKSARTKYIRSLTPRGWAEAVYRANVNYILPEEYHKNIVDKEYLLAILRETREVSPC